ncbi:DUF2490 domain-containing protein [Spirosoma rhododendri]|uniref:DUF2490 domain-containing protein n=1 Tax=Spirosoma rhododendri TaxID=2728024 RepID=A0A7L5DRE5_9BACT|nr:DUF2490 domain-containing protein [Spirosoma rhododendri]QJD79128.1 DUF2490 domain-containing protein [Spirosoma rhododendri]
MKQYYLLLVLLGFSLGCLAQQNRLIDRNAIGWYTYNGDHKIAKRWTIHTEYQWRRVELIRSWQQSLSRLGANYKLSDRVKVGGGYTFFVTYPYGDYPVADQGVPTLEHRAHEEIQLSDQLGTVRFSHRFRFEQRWLSIGADNNPRRVTGWEYQNRVRYQLAGTVPLAGPTIEPGEFYANFFDELFMGYGRNVGDNIFNQNRISGGFGYQFLDNLQLELNYLNQITQHPESDPISGKPVFEINHGFRLNLNYDLDFTKR